MIDTDLLEYLESFLTENRRERFNEVLAQRTRYFTVATEDVFQLHNTSAVIRSCDVFGIQDLHVIEVKHSKSIDKEIAMGAQKWVDIHTHHSSSDCIKALREQGYQIVATTPHKNDGLLQDFDIGKPSCFFFGTEAEGLSETVMEQADCYLKIPMSGFTESLNISVSAAIILQHVTAKLRQSDIAWQLSEDEKLAIRLNWCKQTIRSIDQILERYHKGQL